MSDRDDVNVLFTDSVYDVVRKAVDPQLPAGTPCGPGRTNVGMGSNQIDRFIDRIEQFGTEPRPLLLVPADGFGQLGGRGSTEVKTASPAE